MVVVVLWLKEYEKIIGKFGVVGFCFGGYIVNFLVVSIFDKVDVVVFFYGILVK